MKKIKTPEQKYRLQGVGFKKMASHEMKAAQGSGNNDGNKISQHTFAAKVLMKKSR